MHLQRIYSVINELLADINFEVSELQFSERSGLSQVFKDQSLSQQSNPDSTPLAGKDDSQSSLASSNTPNTSSEPSGEHSKRQRKDVLQNNSAEESRVNKALPCRAIVWLSSFGKNRLGVVRSWKNELLPQLSANHGCRTSLTIILTLVSVMQVIVWPPNWVEPPLTMTHLSIALWKANENSMTHPSRK
jgi:hypothetical protein